MFPHTITIYRYLPDETYMMQIVDGFYWYGSIGISASGKGTENSDNIRIISSPKRAKFYNKTWTVKSKDRIIKGKGHKITSFKDLKGEVITVVGVEENICNSDVDNITITGR